MSQDRDQLGDNRENGENGMEVDGGNGGGGGNDLIPMIVSVANGYHRSLFARYVAERAVMEGWDVMVDELVDNLEEVEEFIYEDDLCDAVTDVDSDEFGDMMVEVDPDELAEELDDLELVEPELDEDEETWSWTWSGSSGDSIIALMEEDANY